MAEKLDPISPSDINIDNIDFYHNETVNVINEIETTDILKLERDIMQCNNNMDQVLKAKKIDLQKKHLHGSILNRPVSGIEGMIYFIYK